MTEQNIPFKRYSIGSYFGDNEVILKKDHEATAMAETECVIYILKKKDLPQFLEGEHGLQMLEVAQKREEIHKEAIEKVNASLKNEEDMINM